MTSKCHDAAFRFLLKGLKAGDIELGKIRTHFSLKKTKKTNGSREVEQYHLSSEAFRTLT